MGLPGTAAREVSRRVLLYRASPRQGFTLKLGLLSGSPVLEVLPSSSACLCQPVYRDFTETWHTIVPRNERKTLRHVGGPTQRSGYERPLSQHLEYSTPYLCGAVDSVWIEMARNYCRCLSHTGSFYITERLAAAAVVDSNSVDDAKYGWFVFNLFLYSVFL